MSFNHRWQIFIPESSISCTFVIHRQHRRCCECYNRPYFTSLKYYDHLCCRRDVIGRRSLCFKHNTRKFTAEVNGIEKIVTDVTTAINTSCTWHDEFVA